MKQKQEQLADYFAKMVGDTKTTQELFELLFAASYTIGGMVCHFDQEGRAPIFIKLTEAIGMGFVNTAKDIGEPSDLEIIVGQRS
jgi:hypothetical protein